MVPDDDLGAADLLRRLSLLLHATAASPSDATVLQLALAQAVAATGADIAVLGRVTDQDVIDVTLLFDTGATVHEIGVLDVDSRYPLTDVVVRERAIWLASPPEIRLGYPDGGALWGCAFAGVPLMAGGVAVGAIGLIYDATGHYFTAAEREYLSAVADLCATVLAHPHAQTWPPREVSPVADT
ncbi:GAF domain-containing protein [Jidongwangia harbinensis]|uniref:GAF domain-containing protein n=1 Tax=Jidongwangia harbinensis TaxID=2878561 RepID=UPI001CD9183B|nr:GAF domain-containing protein [Jidongwangia harbinensis]MCA2211597.1 GAF domain-containing protein [Jidongwangia harbinensis]